MLANLLAGIDPQILLVIGAFIGMVAHMMKKRVEDGLQPGETEFSIFYKYIIAKPVSTGIAAIAAVGVAEGLGTTAAGASPLHSLLSAITAGFAANSLANRPGKAT